MAEMALPAQFSLLDSELNGFLFAPMGTEESGATLSVLSALTRLNIDPWVEGARLANLPKEAAVRALARVIALFPQEHRSAADVEGPPKLETAGEFYEATVTTRQGKHLHIGADARIWEK